MPPAAVRASTEEQIHQAVDALFAVAFARQASKAWGRQTLEIYWKDGVIESWKLMEETTHGGRCY